jgi:hypothetical protein
LAVELESRRLKADVGKTGEPASWIASAVKAVMATGASMRNSASCVP